MITETSVPSLLLMKSRIPAALASGSSGKIVTCSGSTFVWSTPAFAQTKPCLVREIITCPSLTISLDCCKITSTSRESLSSRAAICSAFLLGFTPRRSTTFPSAFEIIVCATTMTSPSSKRNPCFCAASTMSFPTSSPFFTSGNPLSAMSCT
ncbi:hypothetical protein ES703_49956 [subsurface metagenome]